MEIIQIRPVRTRDIQALINIEIECGLSRWSHTDYSDEIARTDSVMLIASIPELTHAGFLVARFVPGADAETNDAEIYNIGVSPAMQGRGLGSRLMNEFLAICDRDSIQNVWLDVRKSNSQAISFYSTFGFTQSALRRSFYNDPVEDGIVMNLRFNQYFVRK